jgi:ankyrin repeat protein
MSNLESNSKLANFNIIDLIKNKKINELEKIIKNNKDINFNVKDENFNYFIYYVLLYNYEDLLKIILTKQVRLDILDSDGRNILYIPIKFSYNNILKNLLVHDFKNIGVGILDIKDKLGLSALQYSIIFNNIEAFTLLLEYQANYLINNNQGLNSFHIAIQYNRKEFFIELLNKITEINFITKEKENLLHFCINYDRFDFITLILKKKINVNVQEDTLGLTPLHMAITKNNINTIQLLINHGAQINLQDFYGNSSIHYAVSEKNEDVIQLLFKYQPNYNLTNIEGKTALHVYLENSNIIEKENSNYYLQKNILEVLIQNTDLNIQNNDGVTCLKKIFDLNLFNEYKELLKNKELNFFIQDNHGEDMSNYLQDKYIFTIAVESYYYMLIRKEKDLVEDWEKWCSISLLDKLKSLKINKNDPKEICLEKIKDVITKEKRTLPKYSHLNLIIDNGIFLTNCFYTGIPLDIIFGLIFLHNSFKTQNLGLILDYPLTINTQLENYYQKIGIDYSYKIEFSNCEILWSFQKIFFPSFFDYECNKKIHDKNIHYIVIPLGIEVNNGSHANILFIDKNKKTVERFEPNGANYPEGLNYNPVLLDDILENKFVEYNLKYLRPSDFLPVISFQALENIETMKCKKIGDPNGFCGVWCTWWAYHRMKNPKIENKILAEGLIQLIKMENKSFKTLIRNFSYYIVEIRDKTLKKFNIDINDWMVNNITNETINNLEKEILKLVTY